MYEKSFVLCNKCIEICFAGRGRSPTVARVKSGSSGGLEKRVNIGMAMSKSKSPTSGGSSVPIQTIQEGVERSVL